MVNKDDAAMYEVTTAFDLKSDDSPEIHFNQTKFILGVSASYASLSFDEEGNISGFEEIGLDVSGLIEYEAQQWDWANIDNLIFNFDDVAEPCTIFDAELEKLLKYATCVNQGTL